MKYRSAVFLPAVDGPQEQFAPLTQVVIDQL